MKEEMILWHGSKEGLQFPIKYNYGNSQCDFGLGFYLGLSKEQPEDLISDEESKNPTMYEFKPDLSNLTKYEFKNDEEWVLYIARNRGLKIVEENKKLLEHLSQFDKYDILVGTIADDRFTSSLKDFFRGRIKLKTLIECLDFFKYGKQLVCKTQKATDRFNECEKREYKLSEEKIKQYRDKKEERMSTIDKKLQELMIAHRSSDIKSPYFDELIKEF